MTRDDIIRMAMESGITRVMDESSYRWLLEGREPINEVFIKFAALVAAAEREACARTAMELLFVYIGSYPINEQFADAIRARGEHE